jgi:ubiquinone biosynthesis accessory factor UbiK
MSERCCRPLSNPATKKHRRNKAVARPQVNGCHGPARYNASMSNYTPNPTLDKLTSLAQRVGEVIAASPAGELERNARQHFVSQLAKQGLVTREEFDAQRALLEKTRAKLQSLEDKIAALEHKSA